MNARWVVLRIVAAALMFGCLLTIVASQALISREIARQWQKEYREHQEELEKDHREWFELNFQNQGKKR